MLDSTGPSRHENQDVRDLPIEKLFTNWLRNA